MEPAAAPAAPAEIVVLKLDLLKPQRISIVGQLLLLLLLLLPFLVVVSFSSAAFFSSPLSPPLSVVAPVPLSSL
jgi:hypothetical protein